MLKSQIVHQSSKRYFVLVALLLALLAAMPLPVVAGSLSGDDAYDPAAGSYPELFIARVAGLSGDAAYDPAAGAYPELFVRPAAASLSGDDAYDPAAGGLSEFAGRLVEADFCPSAGLAEVGRYSGDDAYDPAAMGNPLAFSRALACAF